jgi:hypothetical protein
VAEALAAVGRDYDVVLLDCPPGMSLLTDGVFAGVDAVLVPAIPTVLSLRTVSRLVKRAARTDSAVRLAAFFNMVDRRKTLHRRACELSAESPGLFLSAQVPYASVVEQMGVRRMPLAAFAERDAAALAFAAIWSELDTRLAREPEDPRWELKLEALQTMMHRLEADHHGIASVPGPMRLLASPAASGSSYVAHGFDTERRHLERAGSTLEMHERAGTFFVVATCSWADQGRPADRAQVQIDAGWAREILCGTMSPVTALERRLGPTPPRVVERIRSLAGERRVHRLESRTVEAPSAGNSNGQVNFVQDMRPSALAR